MTSPASTPGPVVDDVRPFDQAVGWALRLPILSGLLWLILGSLIGLVHSIQLHTPGFFGSVSFFTFGRIQAAAETALLYGFVGNAGLAVAVWLLGRLSGGLPRGLPLSTAGALLWNLGVTAAVAGDFQGYLPGFAALQLPGYTLPIFLVASAAVAAPGIFAWSDRSRSGTFAGQWYAVAALFVFPWLLSLAYVFLHLRPASGVASAITAAWVSQNILSLWVSPIILAILYYLVPRITGRELPSYSVALGGFWALFGLGSLTGTRVLAGGPFPVWVSSLGIAATLVLLIHYVIVAINLRTVFNASESSLSARFLSIALASYLIGGLWDAVTAFRSVAVWTQFTYVSEARLALLIVGSLVPAVLGALYFSVPRLTGKAWASAALVSQHFKLTLYSVVLLVVGLLVAGIVQAVQLADSLIPFSALIESLKPWLLLTSGGYILVTLGASYMLVNLAIQFRPSWLPCPLCQDDSKDSSSAHVS